MAEKRPRPPQQDGVLVLNKPSGPTSAACLQRIKYDLGQRKIGHAGTLDPLASGVLVVLLGQATKISHLFLESSKAYIARALLGVTTDTYDIEGKTTEVKDASGVTEDALRAEISAMKQLTEQEVPAYSAAKHQGKPLYELARTGQAVPVKTKEIQVFEADVLSVDLPRVDFRVRVSSGVYVRSLVHSLGQRLGCGAVLEALTRQSASPFGLDQAVELDTLLADPDGFAARVLSIPQAMHGTWPILRLSPDMAAKVKNGVRIGLFEPEGARELLTGDTPGTVLFVDDAGRELALAEALTEGEGRQGWAVLRGLWQA